ncbi:MAG: SAM-dependent methyltransferase, partial [Candidatus Omnitrophica bacterium]|nr:SAM-dependent methyltransferase [Candidatus Omnitrophota bacterium]
EQDRENQEKFLYFDFDILMTNPPFAGTVKEREILRLYELAEKNGKLVNKVGRHILFLERSLDFVRPGGRMAIVLPQGLLNNTNAEYIRRFVIDEAKILAVVGLHGNTFKPHTGTKTSVLFLQKYTEKEKEAIQKIKTKYENAWEKYFKELCKEYEGITWNKTTDEDKVPQELKAFTESYFEAQEDIKDSAEEETGAEEKEKRKTIKEIIEEIKELEEVLNDKQEELKRASGNKQAELKKEIKVITSQVNKLNKEAQERTLSGQIALVLSDEKISAAFKKFWLEGKVIKEIDYPIFFAVNQKPVKDESGDYRYKKDEKGDFVMDENGHPIIEHDLDEIAEAFVDFAKKQGFDFWRQ